MYGEENVSDLLEIHFERLATDPFHHGTFTHWPVPADVPVDAQERLAANVGRVFFSEQSSSDSLGFSVGDIQAATETVIKMLSCRAGEECEEYEETPYWPQQECAEEKGDRRCLMWQKKSKTRKDP